ncbi:hypothetical protein Tco_0929855, partial [Tanacetum coccineum]
MVEEVTSLKKDFKQKENKYLEEFLDMKALKEKVEDKLYKQDQSLQTVHMLCKPKPYYDEQNKVAIGYKNPLCLTRINTCTDASGSQPRSNTKNNKISSANSDNKKQVEEHPRTNKSSRQKSNRVNSSISSKRTVIDSNSRSVCKTCNKCFISANHDMCVVNYLTSVNVFPSVKNVVSKIKNVWKPKQVKQVKTPTTIGDPTFQTLNLRLFSNAGRIDRPLTRDVNFRAIMGYGDYVIGDSVISKVYYVEGLGHNLFSVRQFCDSDMEVAFRKHSSYVRDTNGVELIKGSRSSNLYTFKWLQSLGVSNTRSSLDKMADENVPAPAPTRSDDQILPFAAWVPIKKSNYVLDLQKKQKNPIFHIFVDILQNTNFFRAFTASTSVPAINIQQFWNTLTYEAKTGAYSFELDETKFVLDANLLWEDLEIMPIDQAHQFVSPPSGDAIMDFVNELGYTEGIITSTNVDYVELMWEEFVQDILTFLTDKANLGSPTKKGGKYKAHVIPYCRFTKIIICHLGRTHNIHQRSASLFHLAEEDLRLGNLKFVPKVKEDEVFGMPIPNELISNNIRNAPYYNAYLEMVAKHDQKIAAEKAEKNKPATTKGKVQKLCKGKPSLQLMDEDEPTQPEPEPEHQGEDAETGADTDKTNNGGDTKILQIGEEQGDVVTNVVNLDEKTIEIDEGQARSDPDPRISSVALAGPDPEPTHDEFMANMYPNVQESLKFLADEHVILEDPLSSTETLSSMKNLEDAYAIGDQFFNEKSTKDEPGKFNVEAEVVSIVNVPIYQASSSVSPLSTP